MLALFSRNCLFALVLVTVFCFFSKGDILFGKAAKPVRPIASILPFPDDPHSFETPDVAISGIAGDEQRLFFVVSDRSHLIVTPFAGFKASRDETFGPITASSRHPLGDQPPLTNWHGVSFHQGRLLLLDGQGVRLLSLSASDFGIVARRSIAWDLIKPAADAKGEPTRVETEKLRAQFKREFQRAGDIKLSGLARLNSEKNTRYLVATRLAGFPLTLMDCRGEDGSQCYLERVCGLPQVKDLLPSAVSGVAYSAKRKLILLGDRNRNRILLFKLSSTNCFSLPAAGSIELPAKIKALSNLFVDNEDRLWVVSSVADDFLNASAYVWEQSAW